MKKIEGFTLVEVMIVVCIIGMLGAVAIPSMRNARIQAQAMGIVNDMRVFEGAFKQHSLDYKTYYEFVLEGPNPLPSEVAEYIKVPQDWVDGPVCGGKYVWVPDWTPGAAGYGRIYTLEIWNVDPQNTVQLAMIDKQIDDGIPGWSGKVAWWAGQLCYVIESK